MATQGAARVSTDRVQGKNVAELGRGLKLAKWVAGAKTRQYPPEVIAAAKAALIDFFGCAIGAIDEFAAQATRAVALAYKQPGNAFILGGGTTGASMAALVNGTMAHCMDYDDTHLWGGGHISAPCWSAALAVASDRGLDEKATLSGFITGFEVMGRIGGGGIHGIGRSLQQRGLHPTGINGCVGSAAVTAAMLGLDERKSLNAISVGATVAGGLVASFGSDLKPFHAGRAAMDGILAADLAANGFNASASVFERQKGMLDAFIQDHSAEVPVIDFDDGWELFSNGYKPFACCRATHASIQAAQSVANKVGDRKVKHIRANVHANAPFTAGKPDPQTPLEAKFSVAFCVAMGLRGYHATAADFNEKTLRDPAVRQIVPTVELVSHAEQAQYVSVLEIEMEDGEKIIGETKMFLGHPDNPMSPRDHEIKFMSLVKPIFGAAKAEKLFAVLTTFDRPGSIAEIRTLVGSRDS